MLIVADYGYLVAEYQSIMPLLSFNEETQNNPELNSLVF